MTASAQRLTTHVVELHGDAGSLPAPTGDAGGDVSSWPTPGARYVALSIDGDQAITLTNTVLCARIGGAWRVVRTLATSISLTATLGHETVVELVAGADRWALQGTLSAGAVSVRATPLEVTR